MGYRLHYHPTGIDAPFNDAGGETTNETPRITKAMRSEAVGGTVRIGDTGG